MEDRWSGEEFRSGVRRREPLKVLSGVLPSRVDGLPATGRASAWEAGLELLQTPGQSSLRRGQRARAIQNGTVWFGRLLWGVMEGEDLLVLGYPGGRGWSGELSLEFSQGLGAGGTRPPSGAWTGTRSQRRLGVSGRGGKLPP